MSASASSLSIGAAIYISIKPIIKIFLNGSLGFLLAKHNLFTVEFCKTMSIIIVNYFTPCMVFSRVVSTIDSSDIKTIGVLVLMALIYQGFGLVVGLIMNFSTPVPKGWRGGMLIMGIYNNAADLPVAYVTTLANGSQFSSTDGAKGTSYAMVFTLVFIITLFSCGAFRLVEHDFKDKLYATGDDENLVGTRLKTNVGADVLPVPDNKNLNDLTTTTTTQNPEIIFSPIISIHSPLDLDDNREFGPGMNSLDSRVPSDPEKNRQNFSSQSKLASESFSIVDTDISAQIRQLDVRRNLSRRGYVRSVGDESYLSDHYSDSECDNEDVPEETIDDVIETYSRAGSLRRMNLRHHLKQRRYEQQQEAQIEMKEIKTVSAVMGKNGSVISVVSMSNVTQGGNISLSPSSKSLAGISAKPFKSRLIRILRVFVINLLKPPSSSLIISIVISMIHPLRSLFYLDPANTTFPRAPDGQPVLNFFMDFTTFVGNATVPCGLCMLGATMARLKIGALPPGFWKSVLLMSLAKLVLLPIIAIALVTHLVKVGWIAPDNYMAIFVLVITSGTPGATLQIYLTATYTSPDDEEHLALDCVSAMLVFQYILLLISLSILVTYTLKCVVNF